MTGTPMALTTSRMRGNCALSSGSVGGRWALYSGESSRRRSGLPLSNAQMTPSGENSSTIFKNMETKPNSALVGRPSGADICGGMAWNARCMMELPSMTVTTGRVRAGSGAAAMRWLSPLGAGAPDGG